MILLLDLRLNRFKSDYFNELNLCFHTTMIILRRNTIFLQSTIRYQLKLQGIHHDWSEIVRIMNTQKSVTITVENDKGETIQLRQCSEPSEKVRQIYFTLKYSSIPFTRGKSVWHTDEIFKNPKPDYQPVMDG